MTIRPLSAVGVSVFVCWLTAAWMFSLADMTSSGPQTCAGRPQAVVTHAPVVALLVTVIVLARPSGALGPPPGPPVAPSQRNAVSVGDAWPLVVWQSTV